MKSWEIVIHSENGFGNKLIEVMYCEDMVGVARFLITFKAKRGYVVYKYVIGEVETLL